MDQADSPKKDESPSKRPPPLPPSAADEVTLIGTPAPRPAGSPARPNAGSPGVPVRAPGAAGRGTTVALPRRGTAVPVPPPAPPVTTSLPADLLTLVDPDLTTQDLTRDKLLEAAPRAQVGSRLSPLVGVIPLFVKLGQGGMGAVYYGLHPTEKVGVAVKIVPLSDANSETIQRFYNEVRVAATIKSPHLVPIKDLGEQKGLYYVITAFIPGLPAGSYLRKLREDGATGVPELDALDMVIGAVTGLAEAHKNGMIHGDFRPENILIPKSKDGSPLLFKDSLLADLGLPRMEELGGVLSGSNAALGTPGYMAPEQAVDAKAARKPSDVFSVGATLYTLLAGMPPFPIDNPMTAIMHTIQTPHDPVTKHRKEVSPATAELLDRCLAKKPAERYVDASALLEALQVCREALTQPQMTQHTAIKRITLVLQKSSEVGQRVLGTESGTPSSLPFLAELAAAPEAARKKAAGAAALPPQTESEPTMITAAPVFTGALGKKRDTGPLQLPPQPAPVPVAAPVAPASRESAAMPVAVPAPAPASSFMTKLAIGAAVALVGIVVLLLAVRSGGPTADQAESHAIFLKGAREAAIRDHDAAQSLLDQARKLKISGKDWQKKEDAVEQLIEASRLLRTSADSAAIEKMLDNVEKVYKDDPTVSLLRQKLRDRRQQE